MKRWLWTLPYLLGGYLLLLALVAVAVAWVHHYRP